MTIFAVGVNHTTASVDLRERIAFTPEQLELALPALQQLGGVNEAVIVSTCNRTEVYYQGDASTDLILGWMAGYHRLSLEQLRQHVYALSDEQAIGHLMKVASGLDSLVLGEPQILGQVKQAYQFAKRHAALGGILERLFQKTFGVAKTVRTETGVGQNAVSVAFAAVNLARHIFADLGKANVLLVGAGDTAELAAQHLREQGIERLMVANRTLQRAQDLAQKFAGEAHGLAELPELLYQADIVISSTASTLPIIGKGLVETALKKRKHRPMLFIDLAVPRDIEEQVNELDDAYLYTVDDLQGIITENIRNREQAAAEGEQIIAGQTASFMSWLRSLNNVDMIRDYRSYNQSLIDEQLSKAMAQLEAGKEPADALREFATKLTKQLLHEPTQAMRKAGAEGDIAALAAYQKLYKQQSE
ncbi:glutamyl-tRNA reductase [Pseudidiomarina planktonica]|uniref:Glutamyl-tRNA reductase n=1 Tax=Pseudidiomarina planktonica TaxID=1323738 RepID=A0A1Y6EMS6_9GAMM|nr:glutamyl-tRNA reductase [Pseudidiomarina planktonica]RUO65629.1 glutamyl-tRNA reductase [Pseudidiomarina planktonica]SMQ63964.1 glutamyl-tRNA reductase [Pseudidiomarina planktonica]